MYAIIFVNEKFGNMEPKRNDDFFLSKNQKYFILLTSCGIYSHSIFNNFS